MECGGDAAYTPYQFFFLGAGPLEPHQTAASAANVISRRTVSSTLRQLAALCNTAQENMFTNNPFVDSPINDTLDAFRK